MKRIGFVGVPGSGKSSLARGVAAQSYNTLGKVELVSEYARRYISKYGSIDTVSDQYKVMQKQIEWENSVPVQSTDVLITDSPIFMGFLYAMEMRDVNSIKDTMYVNDIFKTMNKLNCPHRYDIIFHLPPVWKPSEDGVRPEQHFQEDWRNESDMRIQFIFKLFPPKQYIIIASSTLDGRISECLEKCSESL